MNKLLHIHRYVNRNLELEINTNNRKRPIVDGRFLFFAIAKKTTKLSLERIGLHLNKDHASVLHGVRMFKDVLMLDRRYKTLYHKYIDENWVDPEISLEIHNERLREKCSLLEDENETLKINLKKKLDFIDGFYGLPEMEQYNLKVRIIAMIKMMPSNQKRKEVFQIINCAQ